MDRLIVHISLDASCLSENLNRCSWNKEEGEHAVAQLLEALRYKQEGRGFDSRCCHKNFHWHGPGFDSASNRKEYQEYFLRVKAAGA